MTLRWPLRAELLIPLLLLLSGLGSRAQTVTEISLDGSLPNGRTDVISDLQPGPAYQVLEEHGWVAGPNLFHSFLRFDVGAGDSVTFQSVTPNLANVIARVTGGDVSDIDGVVTSQVPGADFYLLNPSGILFGPASQVNVPASLFIGTATDLHFANGDALDLQNASDPVLSVAAPEAFGFDGGGPAAGVEVASAGGSPFLGASGLATGESFTIAAGGVDLFGDRTFRTSGGVIQIAAVGSSSMQVPVGDVTQADWSATGPHGEVAIRDGTILTTRDNTNLLGDQGTIAIRAGRFALTGGAELRSAGDPSEGARALDVLATGTGDPSDTLAAIEMGDGARVTVDNAQTGTGEIVMVADGDDVLIRDGALIQTFFAGDGDGGAVRIIGRDVELRGDAQIVTATQTSPGAMGGGRGADVEISAERLTLSGGAVIRTLAVFAGAGGGIVVDATEAIELSEGAEISTANAGTGAGGSIELTSPEVELHGGTTNVFTENEIEGFGGGIGQSGDVSIIASQGALRVLDGAVIATETSGSAAGGNITIQADSVEILDGGIDADGDPRESAIEAGTSGSGAGGSIDLTVGELRIGRSEGSDRAGRLATAASSAGASGDIDITAGDILLEDGGQISTTTEGTSAPGSITILASGNVALRGQDVDDDGATLLPSGIFTRAEQGSLADAGSIAVEAENILVEDGAEVSSVVCAVDCLVVGGGASGSIDLTATGLIRVAGAAGQPSAVTTEGIDGNAGDLSLTADVVEVLDGGRVDVTTSGSGTGGQLTIQTGDLVVEGESSGGFGSVVAAQTRGVGAALGIDIDASRSVRVGPGGEITAQATSTGIAGSPGDITIDAPMIAVDGGRVSTQAGSAAGGDITLTGSQQVSFDGGAELSARSSGGDAGNILVEAPSVAVRNSQVIADADEFGGEVTLRGSESVLLENARVEAFSRGGGSGGVGDTAGGNVSILGGGVVLNRSVITADGFGNADGGNILLSGNPVLQSTDTQITFSSQLGQQGTFVVQSPYTNVTGDLVALPENFLDASALLEEACLARDAPSGSFAVRRVGQLPASPDAPLALEPEDLDGGHSSEAGCRP